MKLIFTEYLASLRERGELDVILPDLLSEIGLSVISRPSIGTKQYGVDVAAVGKDTDDVRKVFLVSIKAGDLRRSNWDVGEQSLRTSLNQVLDVYIPHHIPKRYASLPVVVVLSIGGMLNEDVRADVEGFMEGRETESIKFNLWNGDHLADALLSGVLRENFLPESWRSDFRKCVALVDEPDVSFGHFSRLVASILEQCKDARRSRLRALRQIYLGLWTLYVWAREGENIDAAYLASERAVLSGWFLVKDSLDGRSKEARQIRESMARLISLHGLIADDYITNYVEPRSQIRHGLTSAVPSQASLDINLRMFDVLGRVAMRGLWLLQHAEHGDLGGSEGEAANVKRAIQRVAETLAGIIFNNPILFTPIKDNQAIDIDMACLFLRRVGCNEVIEKWIEQISRATIYAYRANGANGPYPCVFDDYRDLIGHPQADDEYRVKATEASILIPTLAVWAAIVDDSETLRQLAEFVSEDLEHCALQLWYPGPDTEERLYLGGNHGLCAAGMRIRSPSEKMLSPIRTECTASGAFFSLSAYSRGMWPLLVLASRHHRMPVPPQLWPL